MYVYAKINNLVAKSLKLLYLEVHHSPHKICTLHTNALPIQSALKIESKY